MKKNNNTKLFLPLLISVVVTILFFYFSMLFVEDYREIINYIFIGIIYTYIYVNLYKLFNNLYINSIKKYINILKKIKLIKSSVDTNDNLIKKNKDNEYRLIVIYMFIIFIVVSILLLVWQMILGIKVSDITSIICLIVFFISLISSIIIIDNSCVIKEKNQNKKENY